MRLRTKEFKAVFENGSAIHTKHLMCKMVFASSFKAGVSVSKKVQKKAVCRNQIRRKLYAVLRDFMNTPRHIIVIVKKHDKELSYTDLHEELQQIL